MKTFQEWVRERHLNEEDVDWGAIAQGAGEAIGSVASGAAEIAKNIDWEAINNFVTQCFWNDLWTNQPAGTTLGFVISAPFRLAGWAGGLAADAVSSLLGSIKSWFGKKKPKPDPAFSERFLKSLSPEELEVIQQKMDSPAAKKVQRQVKQQAEWRQRHGRAIFD